MENDQCSNHINTQDNCDDSISSDNLTSCSKNSNEETTAGKCYLFLLLFAALKAQFNVNFYSL